MYVTWYKQELGEGGGGGVRWETFILKVTQLPGVGGRGGDNTDFHRSNTAQTNFNPQSPFSFNFLDSLA